MAGETIERPKASQIADAAALADRLRQVRGQRRLHGDGGCDHLASVHQMIDLMKSGRKKRSGAQGRGNLIVPDQRLNGRWEGKSAPAIPLFSECRFPTGLDPRA